MLDFVDTKEVVMIVGKGDTDGVVMVAMEVSRGDTKGVVAMAAIGEDTEEVVATAISTISRGDTEGGGGDGRGWWRWQ